MTPKLEKAKDIYRISGGNKFMVEVHHWRRLGSNYWNVYGFVYPGHPAFERYKRVSQSYRMDSTGLHGGCTYLRKHRDKSGSKISCIEYGSDYMHYMDERFECYETIEDASEVVADAMELWHHLNDMVGKDR